MKHEYDLHQNPLFFELQTLGAGEFKHLNGSLAEHLHNTATLLQSWGANDSLVKSGLYHAAYGTAGYEPSLISLDMRKSIAKLIGHQAEEIVYLYCACDRKAFWPKIGTKDQNKFTDRFLQQDYSISDDQLTNFCELTLANELEIATKSDQFILQYGAELSNLFARMKHLVSQSGFKSCKLIFDNL